MCDSRRRKRGNIRAMPEIEHGEYEFQSPTSDRSFSGGFGDSSGPRNVLIPAVIVVALIALGVIGYLTFGRRTTPTATPRQTAAAAPTLPKAVEDDVERIDLPPLDESDALVRQRIGLLSSNRLVSAWLATKGLVRNFTVVVENISRGVNPSRHLRVLKPAGQFRVMTRGANVVIDPRTYDRFTPIADAAASVDAAGAGRLYRSFKPLLQMAYDELGNQESVDRAVERAIGGLLQVPAVDGDVRVEQSGEGIGYEYVDPRFDGLNAAQKQLLRMGPRNIRVIQQQLRGFASAAKIPLS
jgi:DUF3014 family protein